VHAIHGDGYSNDRRSVLEDGDSTFIRELPETNSVVARGGNCMGAQRIDGDGIDFVCVARPGKTDLRPARCVPLPYAGMMDHGHLPLKNYRQTCDMV
jgi:hypothetical protein